MTRHRDIGPRAARSANPAPASLRDLPAGQRPRERLLALGAAHLTDSELVALLLGSGSRHAGDALCTARRLLARTHDLRGLSRAGPAALRATAGVGPARAAALLAAVEVGRRLEIADEQRYAQPLTRSRAVFRRLRRRLGFLDHEVFVVLALDARCQVIAEHQVAQGGATAVEVHPREVFLAAMREAAVSLIVAHNHPSGDPEPSRADVTLTRRLSRAGKLLGLPLCDHLVITRHRYVSFADRGLL